MNKIPQFTIQNLFDAGFHFGHKTKRWNPKMSPYIYGEKDDLHIIDLQKTAPLFHAALKVIYETLKSNGRVLFVGTKIQASSIVLEYAEKCGQYYVNHRWLGGMLTNWGTVSKSIKKLEGIEKIVDDTEVAAAYTKKEILEMSRKKNKLSLSLGGIRNMGGRPDLLVVIDTNKEHLAISEAQKLGIPVIGLLDTNSDPDGIKYPVPGNDDAIKSITLFCQLCSDAAIAGIEDALIASGVDIGALEKGVDIKKIQKKPRKNNKTE